jgi:hypothetical protein
MSIVQHYDRFKKFNPTTIAESVAKARAVAESGAAAAGASLPAQSSAHSQANRAARMLVEPIAGLGGEKRKAEDEAVSGSEDVDMGDESSEIKGNKVQRIE